MMKGRAEEHVKISCLLPVGEEGITGCYHRRASSDYKPIFFYETQNINTRVRRTRGDCGGRVYSY